MPVFETRARSFRHWLWAPRIYSAVQERKELKTCIWPPFPSGQSETLSNIHYCHIKERSGHSCIDLTYFRRRPDSRHRLSQGHILKRRRPFERVYVYRSSFTTMSIPLETLLTGDNLQYIFNHVFLPPRLPETNDNDDDHKHELVLCKLITECAQKYRQCLHGDSRKEWSHIVRMLLNLQNLTSGLSETELKRSITGMRRGGKTRCVFCGIK